MTPSTRLCLAAPLFLLATSLTAAAPQVPPATSAPGPAARPLASAPAAPKPPALRLPEGVAPTRYAVELTLDPAAEDFAGRIEIELRLDKETSLVWLNATPDLKVESARLVVSGSEIAAQVVAASSDFLGLKLDRPVPPGAAKLQLTYRGRLPVSEGMGIYRERDGGESYIYTHFEPLDARRAFPCFDEPGWKVPWQLTLRVPARHRAVANMPALSETPEPDAAWKKVVFKETPPLPSYLIALAVGPFGVVDAGRAGRKQTPVRILTLKGNEAQAKLAARETGPVLAALEDYFGIPYPYEKLDQIAVPNMNGAMENAGLITYGQRQIQIRPDEETPAARRGYTRICAHELAHQWTGNLVTLAYWDDLWLNESFASFFESKAVAALHPEWSEEAERQGGRAGAMAADSLDSARRIRQPIAQSDDIVNAFDAITYAKGKAVLFMIEEWLGPDVFQRGVRRYLNQFAGRNATARDFIDMLVGTAKQRPVAGGSDARALGDLIPGVMSSFLDQSGVPMLALSLKCDAGGPKLLVEQSRYRLAGAPPRTGEPPYRTPLCVRYGSARGTAGAEQRQCALVEQMGASEVPLRGACPEYVVASASGYYRVQYDDALLARLVGSLPGREPAKAPATVALSEAERVSVLSDLGALVKSGQQPADVVLRIVERFASDPAASRHVVGAAASLVRSLAEIVPPARQTNYERFLQKVFGPRLRARGLRLRPRDDEDTRLLRAMLVALVVGEGGEPQLGTEARTLVVGWLRDPKSLDAETALMLLDVAAQRGDRALFDQIRAAAKAEPDRNRRVQLLSALGGFRDPGLSQAALDLIFGGEFALREVLRVLYRPLADPRTRPLPFAYVQKNFATLVARLPRDAGANLAGVGGSFCEEPQLAEVKAFFDGRSTQYRGGPRILAQTLERISRCIDLRRAEQASFAVFLERF